MDKCKRNLFKCLFVFFTFYKRFRYDMCRMYDEQKLSLYSEEAFYFSFYDDIVKSDSYWEGINLLINDDRSEHPDTINAIRRFNVYPEIALATLWRLLRLKQFFATPYNFYVYAAIFSQASSVGCLFFFAVYLGKSYFSGIVFLMLFFSCFREKFIMRLSAFPLRENFASVYMWCNILLIYLILREKKNSLLKYGSLFVSSFLFLLSWQFSVFVLLTHVISLFVIDLLGYKIIAELQNTLITFGCSYLFALVVTFFPRYMIYTYFPYVLLAIMITTGIYRKAAVMDSINVDYKKAGDKRERDKRVNKKQMDNNLIDGNQRHGKKMQATDLYLVRNFALVMRKGFTSICIFLLLRMVIHNREKDDSHVISLLKVRLNLSNHNFDSIIYSLGAEFNPFQKYMFNMIKESALYEYCFLFTSILLFYVIHYFTCLFRRKESKNSLDMFESPFVFLLIQFLFFVLMMIIISRLRVLALPIMCLLSSLVASPSLLCNLYTTVRSTFPGSRCHVMPRTVMYAICLLACAFPFAKYFPTEEYTNIASYEPTNLEKNLDLIYWMKTNIEEGEPIITDIPTSSFLRATTNFKLVLHPQYEDVTLRKRVQDYYMFSGCIPFNEAKKYYKEKYNVSYFVSNIYRCAPTGGEINAFTISDHIDSNFSKCKDKNSMRFCNMVLYEYKNYQTLYRNGKYSVIYFGGENKKEDNIPYVYFDEKKYAHINWYIPWIDHCLLTDEMCGLHIADVARAYLDLLHYPLIGRTLYKYIESHFAEGNVRVLFHLGEYYDYDVKDVHKANDFYKKAINLIVNGKKLKRGYIYGLNPPCSIPKQIKIVTSYIYFLLVTSQRNTEEEIFHLYRKMHILIETVLFAMENGFYYEIVQSPFSDKTTHTIKKKFYYNEIRYVQGDLCENAAYLHSIRHKREEYIRMSQILWRLAKQLSHLNDCVLRNFRIFEGRDPNIVDYLRFFYIYP
ncbi:C-mannosyltransferase, putative [Plasmodium ovale]|uniref:C-mannosyltransferase, putative n=1 Tax=Plasmodium ovale TaxID=36330 RepID=A0A1D3KZ52_PLAOA|nr:C-mannosyltransferase, putative [Plasmodium ovale]